MTLVTRIAWRNIWRNPRRSAVLVGAVAFGVFAFVGSTAFMDGIGLAIVDTAVDLQGGHIQIARSGYDANPGIESRLPDPEAIIAIVDRLDGARVAPQVMSPGMANSTEQASGIQIVGVDPERERHVTVIADRVFEGTWLTGSDASDEIVIGAALAERLRVRLGEKIVVMASDTDSEVSASAYRITGLYRSGSTPFDRSVIYLPIDEARRLLSFGAAASTISLRLDRPEEAESLARGITEAVGDSTVEALTWKARNPMLEMAKSAYDYSALLTAVILFAAVGFTLVNSFLMVIFERIHELGIMLAQGVRPGIIRKMLLLEAVLVALLGSVVGIALSAGLLGLWMRGGLDLSGFAEGLGAFGVPTVIYPVVDWMHLGLGFAVILLMVGLSVLYPAIKASRFEAVEAINHV